MPERDVTLKVKTEGYQEATDAERKLAEAEEKTTEALKEKAQAADQGKPGGTGDDDAEKIKETAEETEKLTAKQEDLKNVLNSVHPSFGQLIEVMSGALAIAGQLGSRNVDLAKVYANVTSHIERNADAYATLAAGGAAFAAVTIMIHTWHKMREEIEASIKATEDFGDAQSKLRGEQEDVRAQVREALAREQKLSPEELERGTARALGLGKLGYGDIAPEVAGMAAGADVGMPTLVNLAAAVKAGQVTPGQGPALEQFQLAMASEESRQIIQDTAAGYAAEFTRRYELALKEIEGSHLFETWRSGGIAKGRFVSPGPKAVSPQVIEELTGRGGEEATKIIEFMQMILEHEKTGREAMELEY